MALIDDEVKEVIDSNKAKEYKRVKEVIDSNKAKEYKRVSKVMFEAWLDNCPVKHVDVTSAEFDFDKRTICFSIAKRK